MNQTMLTLVSDNITKLNLASQISDKHLYALMALAYYRSIKTVHIFNNGNIHYTGRNHAYMLLRSAGYTWDAKLRKWVKVS